ncbi:MAG: MoxR family ATPase [Cryomorphaceae bacterium]|jgi:MoxR-like ATPase|nr:MoxR family ATPase [Cryomorphaceae bacterium]
MDNSSEQITRSADSLRQLSERIQLESLIIQKLQQELSKSIVGQSYMVERLIIGMLANGHILLEGVPGLAKTLAIKSLSEAIALNFSRVQFTPDLLPADLTGTVVYQQKTERFSVRKGPVFANFILADEINRAPAKVQSALLEAMQERQVTIGEETFQLPDPFLVLATQNPIEQEGTYPLPEAQVDRFMLKVYMDYPNKEEEKQILRMNTEREGKAAVNTVLKADDIIRARALVREVYLDEKVENYIVDLVHATRKPANFGLSELSHLIQYGCSPRATINLALASKAHAFLRSRAFVTPEDVRAIAPDVMRHRIGLTYEAEVEQLTSNDVLKKILHRIEVP